MANDAAVVVGVGPLGDPHLGAVAVECEALGRPFVVLDYTTLPHDGGVSIRLDSGGVGMIRLGQFAGAAREVHSVWWRRPDSPIVATAITDPAARRFAANEWHQVMNGVPRLLATRFVNEPGACGIAHSKALQLATAAEIGLRTPRTLMTNRECDAREFIEEAESRGEHVVLKALGAIPEAAFPTRIVEAGIKAALPQIRWAPAILQEYAHADTDVRAVVVGEEVFAAEIAGAENAYQHDYRVDLSGASISPLMLPDDVGRRLVALTRALGLDMGAVDLRRTIDGDAYSFLEINPSGEWLFLDHETAGKVTAAVAELLTRAVPPHSTSRSLEPQHESTAT